MADKGKEQNQQEPQQSVLSKSITIGLVGGILWSSLAAVSYYFHFSEVSAASFIFRAFLQTDWTGTFLAEVLAIIIVGIMSIFSALIYYMTLKTKDGMWPGLILGLALWGGIFFVLTPIFPGIPSFFEFDSDTLVTTGCLFILYGVFIGYSISYEYQEYNQSAKDYSNKGAL